LWQANAVAARIAETGGPPTRIVTIKTSGDRLQDAPLSEVGGKRLFVKEIEDALLGREIDLAVLSSKDMSAVLPDGLVIGAVLPREDPLDAIVLPDARLKARATSDKEREDSPSAPDSPFEMAREAFAERDLLTIDDIAALLGPTPRIGTGSVRRISQLKRLFPAATFTPIRGNLDTRLRKLDDGEHDALILAAAGLRRLGFASRISATVPADACVPAAGQGIIAIEIRDGDDDVRPIVSAIDDPGAAAALAAERSFVQAFGGDCQTPIGAFAAPVGNDEVELIGIIITLDGSHYVRARLRKHRDDAAALGKDLAVWMVQSGAGGILKAIRQQQAMVDSRPPAE
jgi:hydroxymethylbilane synthase